MPTTGLVLDPCFERHDTGRGHPERPQRLEAIRQGFTEAGLIDRCTRIEPRAIDAAQLRRLHEEAYIDRVQTACRDQAPYIDVMDSAICAESYDIALLAAGTTVAAADAVMAGEIDNAFCAVRPPGHHAESNVSMGFCLFNNVALAADRLISHHGLERVMIIDFDVHHCNGTQHAFYETDQVFVCSLHGHPSWVYPGTGFESETGASVGQGRTLNLPIEPGAGGEQYRAAFVDRVLPAAEGYKPQFILISAGFDAHRADPLAPLCLETPDYEWMSRWIIDLAHRHCDRRLISVLEGGYDLSALAASTTRHVSLLLDYDGSGAGTDHESGVW
jgi:acetoin utilization deacetylase AcuC-like enzyme